MDEPKLNLIYLFIYTLPISPCGLIVHPVRQSPEVAFYTPCGSKFLREFNFANGRFFVFVLRELIFASFSCWELIFAIFRKSPFYLELKILDF